MDDPKCPYGMIGCTKSPDGKHRCRHLQDHEGTEDQHHECRYCLVHFYTFNNKIGEDKE